VKLRRTEIELYDRHCESCDTITEHQSFYLYRVYVGFEFCIGREVECCRCGLIEEEDED